MMKVGVVTFPGSNCDHDVRYALKFLGCEVFSLWHKDAQLPLLDAIVLPGGFSYGDYLRSGAIARFSPIMSEVIRFAKKGGKVLGICNGFQILIESGLLPGSLLFNRESYFVSKFVFIKSVPQGGVFQVPIAHGEGRYYANPVLLEQIFDRDQVAFQYVNASGETLDSENPNGSVKNIAGVCNEKKNVLGMMPHPERTVGPGTHGHGESLLRLFLRS